MKLMKDSGVEWFGEIPRDWIVIPYKQIMHKVKEICEHYNGEDIISLSMYGVRVRDLDAGGKMPTTFDGYQYVEPDNMLLCLFDIDVTPRCVGVVKNFGLTSPAYSRFVVHKGYLNRYYDYLLRFIDDEKVFVHLAKNLRSSLTETDFGVIKTIVPPFVEQHEIADYLDAQCARIDRAIARQQEVIEKLKEYKLAVIAEAVTKGLNPDVPMKDSGIEWIGEIPEHWSLPTIKRITQLTSGGTPDRSHPEYWNGEIPWIKTGELRNDFVFDAEEYITELGLQSSSARMFDVNTILMAMYGQGKTRGMTGLLKIRAATNQACCGITVNNEIMTVDYLWIFFDWLIRRY